MLRFYACIACYLLSAFLFLPTVFGQTLPPGVAPPVLKNADATNFLVRALAAQPDGKMLVGGDFDFVDGALCRKRVRLNANGTRD